MVANVLLVDDEPNVLSGLKRALHGQPWQIHTAESGSAALELLDGDCRFAAVVSDMRMPGMDGAQLLASVQRAWPDTVRVMLTGNADQKTAIDAINVGQIYRFLTKPCQGDVLRATIADAVRQHELITAERDLLEKTLQGSVGVMTGLLSLSRPLVFGRVHRVREYVRAIAEAGEVPLTWEIETAVMLSQIGCIGVAGDAQEIDDGLGEDDQEAARAAEIAGELLGQIPRLEPVAQIVRYQFKNHDGTGFPADAVSGDDIPIGARLLRVALEFDRINRCTSNVEESERELYRVESLLDPVLVEALRKALHMERSECALDVSIAALADGMVIRNDLESRSGLLLVPAGQEVNAAVRALLQRFHDQEQLPERIAVWDAPLAHPPASARAS